MGRHATLGERAWGVSDHADTSRGIDAAGTRRRRTMSRVRDGVRRVHGLGCTLAELLP